MLGQCHNLHPLSSQNVEFVDLLTWHVSDVFLLCCWLLEGYGIFSDRTCSSNFFPEFTDFCFLVKSQLKHHHFC